MLLDCLTYLEPRSHIAFVACCQDDGIEFLVFTIHKLCPFACELVYVRNHLQRTLNSSHFSFLIQSIRKMDSRNNGLSEVGTVQEKVSWAEYNQSDGIDVKKRTLICPLLILAKVPMSSTGVFPAALLSSSGPIAGRLIPYFSVSPSSSLVPKRRRASTALTGSHLSRAIDSPKVEIPSSSLGKMCSCHSQNLNEFNRTSNTAWKFD